MSLSFSRVVSWFRGPQAQSGHPLPEEALARLASGQAAALAPALKDGIAADCDFPFAELLKRARGAGWSAAELDKLTVYGEFYSGQSASAYERVMAGHLAEADFHLAMTTLAHCYLHGRFEEGHALVRQLRFAEFSRDNDLKELFILCGHLTQAAAADMQEAANYFDEAAKFGATPDQLLADAYTVHFEAGRLERVAQLSSLAAGKSLTPEANFSLAYVELARDYYPEGFRLAECRYGMGAAKKVMNPSLLDKPRWQGEPLAGKRLLVHGEQGFGDLVMMARYLPLLERTGAQVIVDGRDAAVPLLQYNFPHCEIVASDIEKPILIDFDVWTGIMSLPFRFDTTAATVPATEGYLRVPPEQAAYWHARVQDLDKSARPRVGLAWSGNPRHAADRRRSIPFERIVGHVQAATLCRFFALQTKVPPGLPGNLLDTSDEMVTLADTAALIAEMDLVITVDTSIVHIAGAMGKPTWLLLPYRYEWRWSLAGEANNWYRSVRVLRQTSHGDWDGLLDQTFGFRLPEFVAGLASPRDPS